MAHYAGTWEDIARYMTTVSIGTGEADTIKISPEANELEDYLTEVDNEINSILSEVYYIPLRKIKRGSTEEYPRPIKQIAIRMVVGILIDAFYQAAQPAYSQYGRAMKEEALNQVEGLVNGDLQYGGIRRLEGQKTKAGRNHFVSTGIKPAKSPTITSSPGGTVGLQ